MKTRRKKYDKLNLNINKTKTSSKSSKSSKSLNTSKIVGFSNSYKMENCSPNPNNSEFSCYTSEALFKMKEYWKENIRKQTSFVLTCQQAETVDDLIHVLLNLTIIAAQTRRQAQLQAQF